MEVKGPVSRAKLKPDLVWLRRDDGDGWKKVVVDVKITSTDDTNETFRETDENIESGRPHRNRERRRWQQR